MFFAIDMTGHIHRTNYFVRKPFHMIFLSAFVYCAKGDINFIIRTLFLRNASVLMN